MIRPRCTSQIRALHEVNNWSLATLVKAGGDKGRAGAAMVLLRLHIQSTSKHFVSDTYPKYTLTIRFLPWKERIFIGDIWVLNKLV
jgi:hypothetical protein